MKYKAITFDHGGVVVGQPAPAFNSAVCQLLGVTKEEYETVYFRHNKRPNLGEITWEELWPIVLDELGKSEKLPEMRKLVAKFHNDRTPHKTMISLIRTLHTNGYKTGLLSNNGPHLLNELKAHDIYNIFDVVHISALTGYIKPDPQAFLHLAHALHVAIEDMIFIDDSEKSLSTANEAGYTPLLFESYDTLIADLNRLGIDLS